MSGEMYGGFLVGDPRAWFQYGKTGGRGTCWQRGVGGSTRAVRSTESAHAVQGCKLADGRLSSTDPARVIK